MRLRPALVLAAPSGVLAGHALGHLVAPGHGGPHAVDHGYMAMVVAVAMPLAVAALAWAGARAARGRRVSRPAPVGALLGAQCLLFGAQEAVEHALAGHGPAVYLQNPALWVGLAAQVATALALVLALRAAAAAGASLASAIRQRAIVPGVRVGGRCRPAPSWPLVVSAPVTPCGSRGPPAFRSA